MQKRGVTPRPLLNYLSTIRVLIPCERCDGNIYMNEEVANGEQNLDGYITWLVHEARGTQHDYRLHS